MSKQMEKEREAKRECEILDEPYFFDDSNHSPSKNSYFENQICSTSKSKTGYKSQQKANESRSHIVKLGKHRYVSTQVQGTNNL